MEPEPRPPEITEDAADAAAAREARASIEAGEPVIPWEQVKAGRRCWICSLPGRNELVYRLVRWHRRRLAEHWDQPRMGYADLVRLWTSYRGDKYLAHMAAAIDRAEHGTDP